MKTRPLWAAGVLALTAVSMFLLSPRSPDNQAWILGFDGLISSDKSHLCMMVISDGGVVMAPCDDRREQQLWYVKHEQVRSYNRGRGSEDLCLRAEDSAESVYVAWCKENHVTQKWEYKDNRLMNMHSLKCLAIRKDDPGPVLTMETCTKA